MPAQRRPFRVIVVALPVIACVWALLRAVYFVQHSGEEFGVGATDLPQARLWYPVPAPSWVSKLRSAISLGADVRDVPPAVTGGPLPVLIYFGGWPGTGIDNRELIRALASQGFVVVARPEQLASERQSGVRLQPLPQCRAQSQADSVAGEGAMDFSSAAAYEDTLRRADARVRMLARDAVALVDSLESLNRHDPTGRFTGHLDMSRVGILGYSFGGAVAAQAAWLDPRFQAVLNVDGWSFGDAAVEGIRQPYLFISDDTPLPTEADIASSDPVLRYTSMLTRADYPRLLHNLARNNGVFLLIAGTSHASFVDRGKSSRIREILGLGSGSPGGKRARVQRILRSYALAFFRAHLQGTSSELLRGPSSQFPEVRFRELGPVERPS
jgi:dienelactone hydrolase